MFIEILQQLLLAIALFFINPVLYVAILVAIILGYFRVKRERRHFGVRVNWGWSELIGLLKEGLLLALILSIISVGVGLTVSESFLVLLTIWMLVGMVLYFFQITSPIYSFTISFFVLLFMYQQEKTFQLLGYEISGWDVNLGPAVTVTLIAGLVLVTEGLLIRKKGAMNASPYIEETKRGLKAVAFQSKKLWILPLFFIIPGDGIQAYFPWWPQFSLGASEFSLVLFPLLIGFQQKSRKTLPMYFYPKLGRAILILGEVVVIGGLVAYFVPIVGIITILCAFIVRIVISISFSLKERSDVYAVSPSSSGTMIAAVLPNSPAEKMGLVVGEVIRKVNGRDVRSEKELYEALRVNAAHCRIEVVDHRNELRLTQHVVYSDDHYQIGLLFVN